jgi:Fe-S-cluster containining protein
MSIAACDGCPGLCCRDLNVWIAAPRTSEEREDLLWQIQFDTVRIYIRNRRWYLLVKGNCMYLDENNRCIIYEDRPDKCRKHLPPECERYGDFWDIMFNTPDELKAYFEKRKRQSKARSKARV